MRAPAILALACGAVVVFGFGLAGLAGAQPQPQPAPAPAQPTPPPGPPAAKDVFRIEPGGTVNQPVRRPPTAPGVATPAATTKPAGDHGDVAAGSSKAMALMFWLFALITVGGAAFVITRKNLISAVMGMVGSFFGIAAVYMMLFASFLAVVQLLVYAGAIMVLFVFVIMVLNKPEDEPWAGSVGLVGKGVAGLGLAYLGFRLVMLLWSVSPTKTAALAPLPVKAMVGKDQVEYAFGSVRAVGDTLFNGYLFPFEAVSILLLVAVVGAIAVARPFDHKHDECVPPPEGQP